MKSGIAERAVCLMDILNDWHRPQCWREKMYKPRKILQVVGHTLVDKIGRCRNIISCNTFSTYRDGRPIVAQEFLLMNTLIWNIGEWKQKYECPHIIVG